MKKLLVAILAALTFGAQAQTLVKPLNGGTGVANANANTITLGGPLVTSGDFATTITVTAATNATLPAGTTTLIYSGGPLGTPSSGTLTNATGLPVSTGVSGLGTGVATALGVNIGTAGAPVVNGGVLGTPSSGTATNLSGTAAALSIGGNAATATSATTATTATNATNGATVSVSNSASYFPLFVTSSTNGNQPFNLGTGLTFNPSTNTLATTTFSGALSGNATTSSSTTGNAATVTTATIGTNATYYPMFAAATTGGQSLGGDADLTYNPSTNTLTATTFVGALTGTASGNLVSGGALGTPSSGTGTNITNVNAATLGGATFAAPGAIGGGTAAAGSFTTLTTTGASTATFSTNGEYDGYTVTNSNATASQAVLATMAVSNGTATGKFHAVGTGWTPAYGVLTANRIGIYSANAAGIFIASDNASGSVDIGVGSAPTSVASFTSSAATIVGPLTISTINAGTGVFMCESAGLVLSGVTTCVASARRFKNPTGALAFDSDRLDVLRPSTYTYKDPKRNGAGEKVGLYADDVERMDKRCAEYDAEGKLLTYDDRCVLAYVIADRQHMKAEIAELKQFQRSLTPPLENSHWMPSTFSWTNN